MAPPDAPVPAPSDGELRELEELILFADELGARSQKPDARLGTDLDRLGDKLRELDLTLQDIGWDMLSPGYPWQRVSDTE